MPNPKAVGGTVHPKPPDVQLSVQNFGPIASADIDLRPLTVFVGQSNTGKTYLAALIYALHQNFEGFSRVPWASRTFTHLDIRYRYPSIYRHLEHQVELDEEMLDALGKLNTPGQPFKISDLPLQTRAVLQHNLEDAESLEDQVKRCFDLESVSDLVRTTSDFPHNEMEISLTVRKNKQKCWNSNLRNANARTTVKGHVDENRVLLPPRDLTDRRVLDFGDLVRILRVSRRDIADAYYLPAARSGIVQSHRVIAKSLVKRSTRGELEPLGDIPTFSGMIADFLEQLIDYQERKGDWDEMSGIANLLEAEVLRGKIEVKHPAPGGYPEFLYRPQKTAQALRMSRSSSMVSELAPLVLFLRGIVRPGDLLIIEEPEAHLHPGAQTAVVLTLTRLIRAGVRVIVTTHSHWFLQQIANLIREGEVNKLRRDTPASADWFLKEEVGAWWFHHDKPVTEIPFDRIDGIEPRDYEDVAETLYNRSIDLQEQLVEMPGERHEIE